MNVPKRISNCDAGHKCLRPYEYVDEATVHTFAGYGWWLQYHPECCPRTAWDHTECDKHDQIEEHNNV